MLKLSKVSDWLFENIDNFFQGTGRMNAVENDWHLRSSKILNANYIEWELNQGIIDIALFDIKSSFSWIVPRFIRKFASRMQQLGLLYLYTDMAEEEISDGWFEEPATAIYMAEPDKIKVISYPQVIRDIIDNKCSYIFDWLKIAYKKSRLFITLELLRNPYYLLGNFAPIKYEVPETDTTCFIGGSDWVKLNPAFAFHKRI